MTPVEITVLKEHPILGTPQPVKTILTINRSVAAALEARGIVKINAPTKKDHAAKPAKKSAGKGS